MSNILVTGCAGFIGFHLCRKLLSEKTFRVIGVDNMNPYYDVNLKKKRLAMLSSESNFEFFKLDLENHQELQNIFSDKTPDFVINLAAQAGVRYSLVNPHQYITSNLNGFGNILECCRHAEVKHLIYASTSSVYGANSTMPFEARHSTEHPLTLYAATKKANEMMAHSYSHLFNIPSTGLRFFTVYGPWGRPDMALFLFTDAIIKGKPLQVFNNGNMFRDFTYVDDIVEAIFRLMDKIPSKNPDWDARQPNPSTSHAPYRIFNIGNGNPINLMDMISIIEKKLGKKAEKDMLPMQQGDVKGTHADVSDLYELIDFKPSTSLEDGIDKFLDWYLEYHDM